MTQGEPRQAQALCDRFKVPFPCLADPGRDSYRAFGLRRATLSELLMPSVVARGLGAAAKGHLVERTVGDVRQLPGTFIIDSTGTVRWARPARSPADHPSVADIIAALRAISAGAGIYRGGRTEGACAGAG